MTASSTPIRRRPQRQPMDAILKRLEARQQSPTILAPGFLHGSFDLSECLRIEQLADIGFVSVFGASVCIGRFDDQGFLSLHTHTGEGEDIADFCASILVGCTYLVCDESAQPLVPHTATTMTIAKEALMEWEAHEIDIVRDSDRSTKNAVFAKTSTLTLIALLARNPFQLTITRCDHAA